MSFMNDDRYRLTADYHTHTTFSHGKGSVAGNVRRGYELGLAEIAIADHGPGHILYGVRNLEKYLDEIARVKAEYAGKINVMSSLELNFTSLAGDWDLPDEYMAAFDMLIVGAHECIKTKNFWHFYVTKRRRVAKNTDAVIKCLHRYSPKIITHPGYGMPLDFYEIAKACAHTGTLFELNNKHREIDVNTLAGLATSNVKFVLSSDAHRVCDVGSVANALSLAVQAGVQDRVVNIERK